MLTPMMQQYVETKKQYEDCILFYRLGDFYEMFFEDAVTGAREMEIALTRKACGKGKDAPMCGVPYHAADTYIAKLIEKGYKVAIAEQIGDPALSKGLVERRVVRVVTPGTVVSDSILSEKENSYLMSIYQDGDGIGLCWCDISTGEFAAMQLLGENRRDALYEQLIKLRPREILSNLSEEEDPELWEQASQSDRMFISTPSGDIFSDRSCSDAIRSHFKTVSEKSVGLAPEDVPLLYRAVGALLSYLKRTQMQELSHLSALRISELSSFMSLDRATIRNLEITETLFERKESGSLLGVLDRCGTAMGSRRMKQWLRQPLNNKPEIDLRLDAVEALSDNILVRNNIREALKAVYDIERLTARISLGTANARDLLALRASLSVLPEIKSELKALDDTLLKSLDDSIDTFSDIYGEICSAISDEAPFSVREGEIFKAGYSKELDDLKNGSKDARQWIAGLEVKEKERTGIRTLKVGFYKVFGYYIEVSNSFKDAVPENYIRKQTLVNGERYITEELKEYESLVLNAQTRINELEYRLFCELRMRIEELTGELQKTAAALSCIDVLCSFAESSVKLNYVKPTISEGDEIIISKGRHPVIENTVRDGVFVSNDIYVNRSDASMLLITGPNMSGKSTYMRQLALIVLMAQAGCFVPADSAVIGYCDRIYTRIGASDNLAQGQSTFFVEMSELAYILNTASERSLIILDEIGRGTSTYDGLSIAWAVVEYLTRPEHRIRTLFATHYHELTGLQDSLDGVRNLNVDVTERNGDIVFLHKIVPGSASRSYGIHVAKLAGVNPEVLESAEQKLSSLETDGHNLSEHKKPEKGPSRDIAEEGTQMSMFSVKDSVIAQKLRNIDIMNTTPAQAIALLQELKKEADS